MTVTGESESVIESNPTPPVEVEGPLLELEAGKDKCSENDPSIIAKEDGIEEEEKMEEEQEVAKSEEGSGDGVSSENVEVDMDVDLDTDKKLEGDGEGQAAAATGGEEQPSDVATTSTTTTSSETDGVIEGHGGDDKGEGNAEKSTHQKQEAELEAYLESLKPKPKRKTIKEMLMSMPGYKDIANLKPKLGGDSAKKDVIILDDEVEKLRLSKKQKELEVLKDRFVMHAWVPPVKPKGEEHVKLKIKRKEEDSQGVEHLVEGEVDYVRNPMNEQEDANSLAPLSFSPQGDKPGSKLTSLRQTLMKRIKSQKMKEYEERVKIHKQYNDEEGGEEDNEEIVEDDEIENSGEDSNSDSGEEEDEEEIEYLLKGPKKPKKKSLYVDDEAEDEEDVSSDEDEDDDDDDDSDSAEEQDGKTGDESESKKDNGKEDLESVGDSQDSLPLPVAPDTPRKEHNNEDTASMDFGVETTPTVKPVNTGLSTPTNFWISAKTCIDSNNRSDGLSPLIPRIQKTADSAVDMEAIKPVSSSSVPESLANVISDSKTKFDDLVDLCSGKFITQQNPASDAIDDNDEFENFDFGDDDLQESNKAEETGECVKTPVAGPSRKAVDGATPKLGTKPSIARRSMQFDLAAEIENEWDEADGAAAATATNQENSVDDPKQGENEDDDEDEVVVKRRSVGKKKRLQFSDDEDDGNDDEAMVSAPPSEDEHSEAEEEEEEQEQEEILEEPQEIPKANPFFNKKGMLKRKFVEDEAELSGSEEESDDEDERGLNHYEMEEGDDEELDENLIRNQVERAHLKQILDDDDRKIRMLQNQYLENGDLHSDKIRDKKFKWFDPRDLTDDARLGGSSDDEEQEDNPDEVSAKLAWIEKRKWISENSHLLEDTTDESQSLLTSFKLGKQTRKKIEAFVDTSTSESKDFLIKETSTKRKSILEEIVKSRKAAKNFANTNGNSLPFLSTSCSEGFNFGSIGIGNADESSKSMTEPMFAGLGLTKGVSVSNIAPKKGSFLSRGSMMLAKLAESTKPGDTVSNVKNNSRNFVFSHITPPNTEKMDGSTSKVKRNANKATGNAQAKKIKVDRSFHSLDETSKQSSVFKFL